MNCNEVASKLQLFIDEELLYQEMEAMSKHLSLCAECQQRFQTEKLFKQTLKDKIMKRNVESAMLEDVKHLIINRAY